jgi:hypothetical protein
MSGRFWHLVTRTQTQLGCQRRRRVRPCLDLLEDRTLLSFGSPLIINTPVANAAVAVGNIFGDKFSNGSPIPDLVTATTNGSIVIARGNGNGTFQQPTTIPIAAPPPSFSLVALVNLHSNTGGPEDIVATDSTDNEVWVLLNQGNGTFGTPKAYSTGAGPKDVVAADLGNGHIDLLTANSGSNSISVLLGNGDGTFQTHQDFSVGVQPVALAVGDVNNDGHPDVVTANLAGNSVSVLRGNGDGTSQSAFDIPVTVVVNGQTLRNSAPVSVALGDFNGDGNLDIVTANSGTASVTVMAGNGDGTFGVEQNIVVDSNAARNDYPTAVVASDLDGDGHVDIAYTEPNRGAIGLLAGNGDGTFVAPVEYLASQNPVAIAVGNLNGDYTSLGNPRQDLVTVDTTDSQAAVLLGQKYATSTTFTLGATTTTYGSPVALGITVSGGVVPQSLKVAGSCQTYVDGQPFGSAVAIGGSASTPNTLAAGVHTVYVVYQGDADFQPSTSAPLTLTVNPAPLSVTALNQSRMYGDVNPAFTYSITGFVGSDFLNQSELSGAPVLSTTALDRTSPAGAYPISIARGTLAYADPDYTFNAAQFVPGRLTIAPAPLSVALNLPPSALTRPYGQANPDLVDLTKDNLRYTGFVNGENQDTALTGAPSVSTLATPASPVGSYTINVAVGSLNSPNYRLTFQAATLTVTPAVLTVSFVKATSVYGSGTQTTVLSPPPVITGFVNGETLATSDVTGTPGVATTATAASPVGTYLGTPDLGTLASTNYTFHFASIPGTGTLTITPAILTVSANDITRYYGLPNPTLAYTISGFVNGQNTASSGLSGAPGLFTPANVLSPVGTYPITITQGTLTATNYNFQIVTTPGTLTVATARLIVAANNTQRSFGTPNPSSFGWVLEREDPPQTAINAADPDPGLSGSPVLSTLATINSSVGTYTIVPTQGTLTVANPNYFLDVANFQPGMFTITPETLVITANPATRTYGASDPVFTSTITGFIIGQSLQNSDVTGAPSFTTTALSTSPVGTYTIFPGIGTLRSSNYLFSFVPSTYTVTPAPLLIIANDVSQPFGSTPVLSASYIGLESGDTAASLTVPPVLSTTATINSLPGNYPIFVAGASSPNYMITYQGGTYMVQRSPTSTMFMGPNLRAALTSPVTFIATVSSGSGGTIPLSGNLTFYDQFGAIGSVPVVRGTAVLTTSALRVGNYQIYAIYGGDNNYQPSSTGMISQMIFATAHAAAPKPAAHAKPVPKPKPKPAPKPKSHAVAKVKPAAARAHAVAQGKR